MSETNVMPRLNIIERHKSLVITNDMNGNNSFEFNLSPYLKFTPRYMCIRQLLYKKGSEAEALYNVSCSYDPSNPIGTVYAGVQSTPIHPQNVISIFNY